MNDMQINMSISAKRDLAMLLLLMIASRALRVNSACDAGARNQSRISELC